VKLTRVTISGSDDEVDPDVLVALSEEYPFVEWGILASESRAGSPRYPSPKWMVQFGNIAETANVPVQASLHLCGALSRRAIAGSLPFDLDKWPTLPWFWQRIQLNGFSKYRLPMLALASEYIDWEWILQVQDEAALLHASELYEQSDPPRRQHGNISALWDLSGGEGKPITWLPKTGLLPMGFAGGLGPHNVDEFARYVTTSTGESEDPTWIDMESGVRTDDHWELGKVRAVLEICSKRINKE
jgi:hypothetical protein